jgi:hypothetical protein
MRRRLAAILGALSLALVVPSVALADFAVTPSGDYLVAEGEACAGLLCVESALDVQVRTDGTKVCLFLQVRDDEIGGVVIRTEYGCEESTFGTFSYSNGFLVGLGPTTITVEDFDTAATRQVTVSGAYTITSGVTRSNLNEVLIGVPDDGCTSRFIARDRTVDVSGTATIGGDAFPGAGHSVIRTSSLRSRCP